ncbi:MAG: hypothetical protein ACRDX8_00515 [Acidimicrobiales bacterium]
MTVLRSSQVLDELFDKTVPVSPLDGTRVGRDLTSLLSGWEVMDAVPAGSRTSLLSPGS